MPLILAFSVTYDESSRLRPGPFGVYADGVPRRRPEDRKPVGGHGPTVIANLLWLAQERGMPPTQQAIAQLAGIDSGTLSYWRTDQRHPDPAKVTQAATAFGVTYRELITPRPSQDQGAPAPAVLPQTPAPPAAQASIDPRVEAVLMMSLDPLIHLAIAYAREFAAESRSTHPLCLALEDAARHARRGLHRPGSNTSSG